MTVVGQMLRIEHLRDVGLVKASRSYQTVLSGASYFGEALWND
jgi:hypothetical protein